MAGETDKNDKKEEPKADDGGEELTVFDIDESVIDAIAERVKAKSGSAKQEEKSAKRTKRIRLAFGKKAEK